MLLVAIVLIIPWKALLHVSGALCTHHQECLKTVQAVIGTIVYRYGVRSGLLQDDRKTVASSTCRD
jgi:hypothetical protein